MPFNRRQMLQLMTSLAVTTACPAMAWEPESPVELELLHAMPGQDAYFRQVAEAFTAKNPKIRIRFRASPANYPEAHQPKSRSKPSRYSSENDVLIEKYVKYTDFFLLSIVYV